MRLRDATLLRVVRSPTMLVGLFIGILLLASVVAVSSLNSVIVVAVSFGCVIGAREPLLKYSADEDDGIRCGAQLFLCAILVGWLSFSLGIAVFERVGVADPYMWGVRAAAWASAVPTVIGYATNSMWRGRLRRGVLQLIIVPVSLGVMLFVGYILSSGVPKRPDMIWAMVLDCIVIAVPCGVSATAFRLSFQRN